MPKVKKKERILKTATKTTKKLLVTYKGVPIRLLADFSKETLHTRRDWQEVFKVIKTKDLHLKLFYQEKVLFNKERQIDKLLPRQGKAKGVHHHQALII